LSEHDIEELENFLSWTETITLDNDDDDDELTSGKKKEEKTVTLWMSVGIGGRGGMRFAGATIHITLPLM